MQFPFRLARISPSLPCCFQCYSFSFSLPLFSSRNSRNSCALSKSRTPLFVIQGSRETPKPVNAYTTLVAHLEAHAARALLLRFQFRQSCFHCLVSRFGHLVVPLKYD